MKNKPKQTEQKQSWIADFIEAYRKESEKQADKNFDLVTRGIKKYFKEFNNQSNEKITEAEVRDLLNQVTTEQISFSRFVEILNEPLTCLGTVSGSLPPDVAEKILKARDAFVERDYDGVWHWLYSIASPNYDKTEPWEDLERTAGRL